MKKLFLFVFALTLAACAKDDDNLLESSISNGEIRSMTSSFRVDGTSTAKSTAAKAGKTEIVINVELNDGENLSFEYELEDAGYEFCYFYERIDFGEAYMKLQYTQRYQAFPDVMELTLEGLRVESSGGTFSTDGNRFVYSGDLVVRSVYDEDADEYVTTDEVVGQSFNSNIELFNVSYLTDDLLDEYRRSIKDIITGSPYYIWSIDGEQQVDLANGNRTSVTFGYETTYGGTLVLQSNYGCLETEENPCPAASETQEVNWEVNENILVEFEDEEYKILIGNMAGDPCREETGPDGVLGNYINNTKLILIDEEGGETILYMEGFGPVFPDAPDV